MARQIFLHIGAMKSGTSFVQQKMLANKQALRDQGVLFPGERWREQVVAVQDVLGTKRGGVKPEDTIGAWDRLVEEMRAWEGTAVVSMVIADPAATGASGRGAAGVRQEASSSALASATDP